ncbi:hypothetical protein [Herpetosiphon llansteffanensis]|uniref:hypothetical protein n=1 Tax=Herpetosiphon llansteffanensis TaxID=2094568 RepID=UPI000D7C510C|nr:hypothetical protein [Herpetosiphon llansteffanensis]
MKLECISAYSNKPLKVAYNLGDVFEVDETIGQHLLNDSPDSFVNLSELEAIEEKMATLQRQLAQEPAGQPTPDPAGQPPPDPQQGQAPDNQVSEPKGKKKATE